MFTASTLRRNHLRFQPSLAPLALGCGLLIAGITLLGQRSAEAAGTETWVGSLSANWSGANWTTTGSNSVSLATNNFISFGAASSSGTTLNDDLTTTSFQIDGITFNSNAPAYTISGNPFSFVGNITNNSSNLQTLNDSFVLSSGTKTFAGGSAGVTLGGTITHTELAASVGMTLSGVINFNGSFTEDGGSNSSSGFISIGPSGVTTAITIGTGGTLAVVGTTSTTVNNTVIGQQSTSTVTVNGGSFNVGSGASLIIGNGLSAVGTLTISSGSSTINAGTVGTTAATADERFIELGQGNSGATGTINLNGGTLSTDRVITRDGSSTGGAGGEGKGYFVFGGDTLQALGDQPDWLQSATTTTTNTYALPLTSVTTTAVSTIDPNGHAVGINNNISGAGGFIINSSVAGSSSTPAGTLTMGNNTLAGSTFTGSTFTGGITVANGKLVLANTGSTTSATGTGAVTLGSATLGTPTNATISGTGYASGLLTAIGGARIAPGVNTTDADGSGRGNFGVAGTLTLGNNAVAGSTTGGLTLTSVNLDFDLSNSAATGNDRVATAGALTLGTVVLNVNELNGSLAVNTPYTLISGSTTAINPSTTGSFSANFLNGTTYTATFGTDGANDLTVTFTQVAVPEPRTWVLSALFVLLVLAQRGWLRRRAA